MECCTYPSNAEAVAAAGTLTPEERGQLEYFEHMVATQEGGLIVGFEDGALFGFVGPGEVIAKLAAISGPAAILAQLRTERAAEVNAKRDAVIAAGFTFDFGGEIGARTLDQRGPEDEAAWLSVKIDASDLVAAGLGTTAMAIRDAENRTFAAPASAVDMAMSAMSSWRASVRERSWALKDAIAAAGTAAAVGALDIDAGWPA